MRAGRFPKHEDGRCRSLAVLAAAGLVLLLFSPRAAAELSDPVDQIKLLEATDDGVLSSAVPPGTASIPLTFHVADPAPEQRGHFVATALRRTDAVANSAVARLEPTSATSLFTQNCDGIDTAISCMAVSLEKEWVTVALALDGLEAGGEYAGRLHFISGGESREWTIRLTTLRAGVIEVQELPAIGLMNGWSFPFRRLLPEIDASWIGPEEISRLAGVAIGIASFSGVAEAEAASGETDDATASSSASAIRAGVPITLWDAGGQGPHRRVRARLETAATEAASETSTALPAAALSFWHCAAEEKGSNSPECRHSKLRLMEAQGSHPMLAIDRRGQVSIWLGVGELTPGEYRGVLRFASDDSVQGDERSRLDLTFQVRDHWLFAVVLMFVASIIGWFGRTYLPARHARRSMQQRIRELEQYANQLAEKAPTLRRRIPHEAGSIGFARADALIAQARTLSRRTLRSWLLQAEILGSCDQLKLRLEALQRYREARLRLQSRAEAWWVAHWEISRKMRSLLDSLDARVLTESGNRDLSDRLDELEARWSDAQLATTIPDALAARMTQLERDLAVSGPLHAYTQPNVDRLLASVRGLSAPVSEAERSAMDGMLVRLGFVWRHRHRRWLDEAFLSTIDSIPFDDLFDKADRELWSDWERAAAARTTSPIRLATNQSNRPAAFQLIEFELDFDPDFSTLIGMHPASVNWCFQNRFSRRCTETDRNRCVQFFQRTGSVEARSSLRWNDQTISFAKLSGAVRVTSLEGHRGVTMTELGFVTLAVGFAIITGLATNYGPTFGSSKEYLALFLWAAGVSASGNAFFYRQRDNAFGTGLAAENGNQ